ncbi:2-oxoglutarate (2OG) and Fe(II)-dependent oxygenase superfamily protein [Tasmannia lanceolata]|uniref:2-oxoglutarate (2OG) and Fe(II)-dependent oxygenase superfamily protein n=1 Tax=Tasmannia lanceolata TaxID=3420 RepID=UPI0040634064
MEVEAEILEPLELQFSDLVLLSCSSRVSSLKEHKRLECLSRAVMESLGPSGPGLLAVTGVPKASALRRSLLPFARKLALLRNEDRRRILKDHYLGSDVPLKNLDRSVSSFASLLKYEQSPSSEITFSGSGHKDEGSHIVKQEHLNIDRLHDLQDYEFTNLGDTFKELGLCMMELGLQLAQVCDKAIGGQELEQSILDSCTAKGRLIHYHSSVDHLILKEARRMKPSTKGLNRYCLARPNVSTESGQHIQMNSGRYNGDGQMATDDFTLQTSTNGVRACRTSLSNLWQQWHYDYGIFTVLTTPMFLSSLEHECSPPDEHTYLQIFDTNKNKIFVIRTSTESFIVQVGESADILSKGKLRSTLHSVCRPVGHENLSRESFVVFLQPAWGKTFTISEYPTAGVISNLSDQESHKISDEIHRMVPPLSARLKDGMTFVEFSRETTKQYYGTSGVQSKR